MLTPRGPSPCLQNALNLGGSTPMASRGGVSARPGEFKRAHLERGRDWAHRYQQAAAGREDKCHECAVCVPAVRLHAQRLDEVNFFPLSSNLFSNAGGPSCCCKLCASQSSLCLWLGLGLILAITCGCARPECKQVAVPSATADDEAAPGRPTPAQCDLGPNWADCRRVPPAIGEPHVCTWHACC